MLGNKGTGREYRDGGCRGGHDQFKWEDVKADAYRENYLGHSVNAPVGRWQKGRVSKTVLFLVLQHTQCLTLRVAMYTQDIQWYAKKPGEASEHITSTLKRPAGDDGPTTTHPPNHLQPPLAATTSAELRHDRSLGLP